MILWLHLAIHRRIVPAQTLQTVRASADPYSCLLAQWRSIAKKLRFKIASHLWSEGLPTLAFKPALIQSLLESLMYSDPGQFADLPVASLGQVYEAMLSQSHTVARSSASEASSRKIGGVYYTPEPIVTAMVAAAMQQIETDLPQVLDPACGGGGFLLAAYEVGIQKLDPLDDRSQVVLHVLSGLYGVDIDPLAVTIAQLSLFLRTLEYCPSLQTREIVAILNANLRCGNAVIGPDFEAQAGSTKVESGNLSESDSVPVVAARPFCWRSTFPDRFEQGGFDLVIGNPPYIDAEWMSIHQPSWRAYCGQHYRTATGNWDLFCVFIEKAIQLCRVGGWVSLIVPNKLLSADYAEAARMLLAQQRLVSIHDYTEVPIFAASVYPIVYLMQKIAVNDGRHPSKPNNKLLSASSEQSSNAIESEAIANSPSPSLSPSLNYIRMASIDQIAESYTVQLPHKTMPAAWIFATHHPIQHLETLPKWGDHLQILGAATVGEAYALRGLIQDNADPQPDQWRFVNSGTIDRYQIRWGEKPLRYLGQVYRYPVVSQTTMNQWSARRLTQAEQPKLIVAGIGQRLECGIDLQGQLLAGKSTSIVLLPQSGSENQILEVTPRSIDLRYLLALLNSRLLSDYLRIRFSGNRLRNGYFRIGPPQLRQLPIVLPDWNSTNEVQRYHQLIELATQQLQIRQSLSGQGTGQDIDQDTGQLSSQPLEARSRELDREIDRWVAEIYQISPDDWQNQPLPDR